jgi:predicted nucleic acid-binding protein
VTSLVVIDAPCVVDVLFNGDRGLDVRDVIYGRSLAAPTSIDMDVVSTLARIPTTASSAENIRVRVELYLTMPLKRYDVSALMLDAWDLRVDCSLGDALYIALAEHLDVPLVTRDPGLAAACSRSILVEAAPWWGFGLPPTTTS